MMPLTDFTALLGINLVLCAVYLRVLSRASVARAWMRWTTALLFMLLWLPVGMTQLPVLAYVRGVSSDPSITLLMLACIGSGQRLLGRPVLAQREYAALLGVLAVAALLLYPLALGWGDWDAYRPGWGTGGMLLALLVLSLSCWLRGLRLLPLAVALALLAWTAGLLESANLWDYLMDPWLATGALLYGVYGVYRAALNMGRRFRRSGPDRLPG